MSTIEDLLTRYSVLTNLVSFISTLDLFHLALSNKTIKSQLFPSRQAFDLLKRRCICDGHGLEDRQAFQGLYSLQEHHYFWGAKRHIWQDEPIEVQLYGTKCKTADTLPCRKCGVNVCEECRYYPREPPRRGYPTRRPHLNSPWQNENLICLCPSCDNRLEEELKRHFLSEMCDCDLFRRWICNKCRKEELEFTRLYYRNHVKSEGEEGFDWDGTKTKNMFDHQSSLDFYCTCGASVPHDTRPRCTWCRRRHLPEDQWHDEWEKIGRHMPMFDEDPCYPPFIGDIYAAHGVVPYPKLKYDGPIWEIPEQSEK